MFLSKDPALSLYNPSQAHYTKIIISLSISCFLLLLQSRMVRTPCCKAEGLKKGAWTQEEDEKLIAYLRRHDEGGWRTLPQRAGLNRCGKSCRLRWANYLRPGIKRGEFSQEEDESIINLHAIHGNKWSAIARRLHGRTDNEIKNHWNTQIKKRLVKKGIDPLSHKRLEKSNIHHHQEEENVQNSNNINLLRSSSSRFLNTVANRFGKTINHNVFSNIIGSGVLLTNHIPSASECERSTKSSITPTSLNLILNQNIIVDAPSLSSSTVSESSDTLKYDNICSDVEDITGFSSNFLSGVVSHNDEEFLMLDDSFLEDTLFMRELTMILEKDKIETTSFSDSHLNMAGMPITEVDDSFEGIKNYFG